MYNERQEKVTEQISGTVTKTSHSCWSFFRSTLSSASATHPQLYLLRTREWWMTLFINHLGVQQSPPKCPFITCAVFRVRLWNAAVISNVSSLQGTIWAHSEESPCQQHPYPCRLRAISRSSRGSWWERDAFPLTWSKASEEIFLLLFDPLHRPRHQLAPRSNSCWCRQCLQMKCLFREEEE